MFLMSLLDDELPSRREQAPAAPLLQPAPQALLEADRHDDRQQAKAEQVPRAVLAEELVQGPEDQRADHRPLDASDAADHDHEDRERGPVDAEGGVGADAQVAYEVQRPGE